MNVVKDFVELILKIYVFNILCAVKNEYGNRDICNVITR